MGTASDFGKQLIIGRIAQQDQILYQTERYHTSMFGYDLPLAGKFYILFSFFDRVITKNFKSQFYIEAKKLHLDR